MYHTRVQNIPVGHNFLNIDFSFVASKVAAVKFSKYSYFLQAWTISEFQKISHIIHTCPSARTSSYAKSHALKVCHVNMQQ